ncbi:MAG: response regulator transcription factor [bacterium]|nr:response regulator transcription factor [bacterium]
MIRVLIAEDHPIFREGVKRIISGTSDIVVAGEAATGPAALEKVLRGGYDVVLLDISLPLMSGLDVLKHLRKMAPLLPVLVLSVYMENQYAVRTIRAGASGYLTKNSIPDVLIQAIRQVARGGKYIVPSVGEKLALDIQSRTSGRARCGLSDREHQILCLIAGGKRIKDIAADLAISTKTVSTYKSRIMAKMRFQSDAELIRFAIENTPAAGG